MDLPPILTNWITSSWFQMNGGVLYGTQLGVPLFLDIINDLEARNLTPTFMDDKTKELICPGLLQKYINMVMD